MDLPTKMMIIHSSLVYQRVISRIWSHFWGPTVEKQCPPEVPKATLIKALEPGDGVVALVAAYVHDHLPPGTIEIPRKKGSFLRWFARFNVVNTLLGSCFIIFVGRIRNEPSPVMVGLWRPLGCPTGLVRIGIRTDHGVHPGVLGTSGAPGTEDVHVGQLAT